MNSPFKITYPHLIIGAFFLSMQLLPAQSTIVTTGSPYYTEEVEETSYTILPDDLNVTTADPFDLIDSRPRTVRTKMEWYMSANRWTIKTSYLQLPYYLEEMNMDLGYSLKRGNRVEYYRGDGSLLLAKTIDTDDEVEKLIEEFLPDASAMNPVVPKYTATYNPQAFYESLGLTLSNSSAGTITLQSADRYSVIDLNTLTERYGDKNAGRKVSESVIHYTAIGNDSMVLAQKVSRRLDTLSGGLCGEKVTEKRYLKYIIDGRTIIPNQAQNNTQAAPGSIGLVFQPQARMMSDQGPIFPNPGTETLNIRMAPQVVQIETYDMQGKLIMNINGNGTEQYIDINTSRWPIGAYLVNFVSADGQIIESQKWIKN